MACPAEETLGNLVAGALPAPDKASLLEHLDGCGSCRFIVAALAHSRSPASASTLIGAGALAARLARGTPLGRYVIVDVLGGGGMGVVYSAYDPVLDRKVAVKLLKHEWSAHDEARGDEPRARLLREAQVMARLSHPNVITVLDVGAFGERDFIAMELIDGATLTRWLGQRARPWREILDALVAAGRGLAAAHHEGLVHRDFKPDNVLVSRAGRVVVTDFGLARIVEPRSPAGDGDGDGAPVAAAAPPVSAPLDTMAIVATRTGAVVGTPAYMAPEQLEGGVADARSDQFSFCVAAFEALFGARPFAATTLAALVEEIRAQRIARPTGKVPAALRRILVRGLAADAGARHPSMESLLGELERHGQRRRHALLAGTGALALGLVAMGLVQAARPSRLCRGAADRWSAAWSDARKETLHRAFAATGLPYAEDAWRGVARAVDGYRDRWVAMHTASCEATRIRGEKSDELYGLELACLDDRLRAASALAGEMAHADAPLVQRAVSAAAHLPALDRCGDAKALRAKVPPPADAEAAARVQALAERRARVAAIASAGRYAEALALARPLAVEAKALGYRPLEAQALEILGSIAVSSADYPAAETALRQAVLAAEAGGDIDAAARDWTELVALYGERLHRFPEAHAAADHARALDERLGGDAHLAAFIDDNLALVLMRESKNADARALLERALALRERDPADALALGATLNSLGNVLRAEGDYAGAVKYHQRALTLVEGALGPAHPKTAQALKSVGNLYWNKGQLDEALAYYRRALAIQERALGPDHPDTSSTRVNLAAVYTQQGKFDAALVEYRSALASIEKRLGADSPELLSSLNNIAVALAAKGELVAAEASARRALAIAEKTYGPVHPDVETALVNLGDILQSRHQLDAAAAAYRRAVAVSEKTVGPEHPHTAEDLGGLGFVLLNMGKPAEALPVLERAVAIGDKHEVDAVNLAKISFALARALEAGGKTTRALALARRARTVLASSGGRQAPDVQEIDAWLAHQRR